MLSKFTLVDQGGHQNWLSPGVLCRVRCALVCECMQTGQRTSLSRVVDARGTTHLRTRGGAHISSQESRKRSRSENLRRWNPWCLKRSCVCTSADGAAKESLPHCGCQGEPLLCTPGGAGQHQEQGETAVETLSSEWDTMRTYTLLTEPWIASCGCDSWMPVLAMPL